MRNFCLKIAYDGTAYCGWQRQAASHGQTVQGALEEGLSRLLQEPIALHGAGRTDAGVHAYGQCASFTTANPMPLERIPASLNRLLPADIVVREAWEVPPDFHARFSAKGKTYRYTMVAGDADVFSWRYAYFHHQVLDYAAMQKGAALFCGNHAFQAFAANGKRKISSYERQIYRCRLERVPLNLPLFPQTPPQEAWQLEIYGEGFLYKMVRLIGGALFALGQGKLSHDDIARALAGDGRHLAPPLPPQGLLLWQVHYEIS